MNKPLMYALITVGSLVGGYIPVILFHVDAFGFISIMGGLVGSLAGIYIAYKLSE